MIKHLLFLSFIIIGLASYAQVTGTPDNIDNRISIGHSELIESKILDEKRWIWIHVPEGGEDPSFTGSYPVLYLLDGGTHFQSVTGLINQLTTANGNALLPKMIIVAILNTDRIKDLTPTHVEDRPTSGGGTHFLDFMEKELMPYIEDKYPVANHKTVVGHSLGGLTVINALVHRPHMFNNYIAIDPSLWYDDQNLLKKSGSLLSKSNLENKGLYVGVANTMSGKMEYSTIKSDTTEESKHIRSILEFNDLVDHLKGSDLDFKWKYYPDDSHGSVPLITEYDALRHLYSWYECECIDELFNKESKLTPEEIKNLFRTHHSEISTRMGYDVMPDEQMINQFGYWLLSDKAYDKSQALFELNIEYYRQSYNAYDSMGDYFAEIGDDINAIKFYKKCLKLGGVKDTKVKMKKLEDAR